MNTSPPTHDNGYSTIDTKHASPPSLPYKSTSEHQASNHQLRKNTEIMASTQNKHDPFTTLPLEVVQNIYQHLDLSQLFRA